MAAYGFVMFDALTAPDTINDNNFFLFSVRWKDQHNRLPDRFVCLVAEYTFGARIPAGDNSIEGFADDGII
jgi:hypothetical protein